MSSSELLDFLEFLPEESATKSAERMGDWSQDQYRQARIVNELALGRYEHAGGTKPALDLSPAEKWIKQQDEDHRLKRHQEVSAQLHGEVVTDG